MQKKITLDYLIKNKMPVYVRNNALKSGLLISFIVKDRHGTAQNVAIPPVDAPFSLNDFTHDVLENATELKKLIAKNVLVIVAPEVAEAYYDTHGSDMDTNTSIYADVDETVEEEMQSLARRKKKEQKDSAEVLSGEEFFQTQDGEEAVSPKVILLTKSVINEEMTPKEALVELKKMKHQLKQVDKVFLLKKFKKEENIRKFVESLAANKK